MLKLRHNITWRELEGEIVVLDSNSWTYVGVNASGALLWAALVDGTSREALVAKLTDTYEIDEDVARRDVDAFIAAMVAKDLLDGDAA